MAMKRLLAELKKHEASWPFVQPVNTDEVTDYLDFIKYPMGAHNVTALYCRMYQMLIRNVGIYRSRDYRIKIRAGRLR